MIISVFLMLRSTGDKLCFLDGMLFWTCVISSVFLLLRSTTGDEFCFLDGTLHWTCVISSVFLTGRCTGHV